MPATDRSVERKVLLGHKIRRFREDLSLKQSEMAEQLEISPSYLNLIEHNQRPVTVQLLFRLGQAFDIDLKEFAEDDDARLYAALREVFGDPLFGERPVREADVRAVAEAGPTAAEAVLRLYKSYRDLREDSQILAEQVASRDTPVGTGGPVFPVEEVRDYLQSESNHFPEIEASAEALWTEASLDQTDVFGGLCRYLQDVHGIAVRVLPADVMPETTRRFDFHRRRVLLSELLAPATRSFQLAVQVALYARRDLLDRHVERADLSSPEVERLCRLSLANYLAACVMMPYGRFLDASKTLRYDIEILQRRFGASFEQVCHRLTALGRPGARGVPFFFIRVDNAGNVSKRLSGGGFHFARFGGTCPRWIVHDAFRMPAQIRTQVAAMPDGSRFFPIAPNLGPIATATR
ncbi:MAG: short-chain fatty acyl-CoA regulator family protein, partial [Rhodospirillales bacterium]|nr:short-chain fatty acyl-CoA regulator family protein [Rhodospirillales bacterium]